MYMYMYKYACMRTKEIRQYDFMQKFSYSSDFFHKALQGTKLYSDKTYRKPFLVSHPRICHPLPLSEYLNVTI